MSDRQICDGCGANVTRNPLPAVVGERADGWSGGELPDRRFHWCRDCALIAFRAVKAAREVHLNLISPERQK
jgi:hypothetical protein